MAVYECRLDEYIQAEYENRNVGSTDEEDRHGARLLLKLCIDAYLAELAYHTSVEHYSHAVAQDIEARGRYNEACGQLANRIRYMETMTREANRLQRTALELKYPGAIRASPIATASALEQELHPGEHTGSLIAHQQYQPHFKSLADPTRAFPGTITYVRMLTAPEDWSRAMGDTTALWILLKEAHDQLAMYGLPSAQLKDLLQVTNRARLIKTQPIFSPNQTVLVKLIAHAYLTEGETVNGQHIYDSNAWGRAFQALAKHLNQPAEASAVLPSQGRQLGKWK